MSTPVLVKTKELGIMFGYITGPVAETGQEVELQSPRRVDDWDSSINRRDGFFELLQLGPSSSIQLAARTLKLFEIVCIAEVSTAAETAWTT